MILHRNGPKIIPLETPIPAERQSAKRHYGVHPYFTRRPHNVVRKYILHYSREGQRVVDPFGGSGVTAVEAALENRIGIQNDINPLANFIASGVFNLHRGNPSTYRAALLDVAERCRSKLALISSADEEQLRELTSSVTLPPNVDLPRNSDVKRYHELFSPRQLVSLAVLRDAIEAVSNDAPRDALRLAWSASLAKLNRTFLSAEGRAESRGGSSIFSIYRYKVAKNPIELDPWTTFEERASNVIAAKTEIDQTIELKERTGGWTGQFLEYSQDIDELAKTLKGSADYIFTDPPYGGHISYLDLSTLWNVWLDQIPPLAVRQRELIVGGELRLTDEVYTSRLRDSVEACLRMLKPNRWLSIVFQHWNVAYFNAILSAAEAHGAELRAAISQVGDPIWSMHKKKNSESVLAGEMILTFVKSGVRKSRNGQKAFDVRRSLKRVLAEHAGGRLYGEFLFNRLVVEAWDKSAIQSLDLPKEEFVELIREQGWNYDAPTHSWVKEGDPPPYLFG
jgi:16S rRNA G966 N2-methylase RsmD